MPAAPLLAVVLPAHNEQHALPPLLDELGQALADAGLSFEAHATDDGSTDHTHAVLHNAARQHPWLRVHHHPTRLGQSAALLTGIQHTHPDTPYLATLDADGQNDPADLHHMLELLRAKHAHLAQGIRLHRQDTRTKKAAAVLGRAARRLLLNDPTLDTGCATRVMLTSLARRLPLHLKGTHRFIPAHARMQHARLIEVPVHHRPRTAGTSKYGHLSRGLTGLADCLALRWMARRYQPPPPNTQQMPADGEAFCAAPAPHNTHTTPSPTP